ncbi:MAG: RnfH family protein [Gammaproteobacteria bacterium]|nr:RnfH family protein [Gammaproteobacteria bacterium]
MAPDKETVEVLYALPEAQTIVRLAFRSAMTAIDAVTESGLLERYPKLRDQRLVLGVYGTQVEHDHLLRAGDRVEICRPLTADPRDMRRSLVTGGRVMGGQPKPQTRS